MGALELRLCSSKHGAVGVGRDVKTDVFRFGLGEVGNRTLWRYVAKALRFNRLDLDGLQSARQRWPAGWQPKYSQAQVTRAQSTIHCMHRFKSPPNCAKNCFMDPEHRRKTRDKACDISTMKEKMASSSEKSALRRLLSTPEAGMWKKTFLTACSSCNLAYDAIFCSATAAVDVHKKESPGFGRHCKRRMSLWPSSRIGSRAECRESETVGGICSSIHNNDNDNTH